MITDDLTDEQLRTMWKRISARIDRDMTEELRAAILAERVRIIQAVKDIFRNVEGQDVSGWFVTVQQIIDAIESIDDNTVQRVGFDGIDTAANADRQVQQREENSK